MMELLPSMTADARSAMFSGENIMNAKFTNENEEPVTMKFGTVLEADWTGCLD